MQSLLEGRSVVDVFVNGEAYPVLLTSTTRPIDDPTDLENVFLKTGDGKIVPMSVIASMKEGSVAPQLNREQQLASVAITAGLKDGMSLGDAVKEVTELAAAAPAARRAPAAACRSRDARREFERHGADLRLCHRHHLPGAGGAVRKRAVAR